MDSPSPKPQLLHIVFGGELKVVGGTEYRDLTKIDFVGAFPDYASAHVAWKAKAQSTVDNALMRYVIVHAHKLLDPARD
jgi:hypothetical protein